MSLEIGVHQEISVVDDMEQAQDLSVVNLFC